MMSWDRSLPLVVIVKKLKALGVLLLVVDLMIAVLDLLVERKCSVEIDIGLGVDFLGLDSIKLSALLPVLLELLRLSWMIVLLSFIRSNDEIANRFVSMSIGSCTHDSDNLRFCYPIYQTSSEEISQFELCRTD